MRDMFRKIKISRYFVTFINDNNVTVIFTSDILESCNFGSGSLLFLFIKLERQLWFLLYRLI